MKKKRENLSGYSYEEKLYRTLNLTRKVSYGHTGYKGNNEVNPWRENAVRHYEDNK